MLKTTTIDWRAILALPYYWNCNLVSVRFPFNTDRFVLIVCENEDTCFNIISVRSNSLWICFVVHPLAKQQDQVRFSKGASEFYRSPGINQDQRYNCCNHFKGWSGSRYELPIDPSYLHLDSKSTGEKPNKRKSGLFVKYAACPKSVKCVPPIQCPAHVQMDAADKPQPCELPDGASHGFCCTTGFNHSGESWSIVHLFVRAG